jgi:glycosyltransferase involved in cell wall biosynthesis
MNILFLNLYSYGGGVEVVTVCMANKFVHEGHSVYIVAFGNPDIYFLDRLDPRVQVVVLSFSVLRIKNIQIINNIIYSKKINFAINQRGENIFICLLLKIAKKKSPVKILSLYHNQPGVNTRIASIDIRQRESKLNILQKLSFKTEKIIFTKLISWNMKIAYLLSDKYILLSKNYINIFYKFIGISNSSKIGIMPNPITLINKTSNSSFKKKKIIFVARLIKYPKHPERIIELWEAIRLQISEWSLEILGDGIERANLEAYCNIKKIERISFTGFVNPESYYAEASILLLVSDYEGFPLVLVEAMNYGVVPVVYHSFEALTDIVTDNKNGLIVKPDEAGQYSKLEMIKTILLLTNNEKLLKYLSENALKSSGYFSLEHIYQKWINLFTNS